jgi:hypothetical protein
VNIESSLFGKISLIWGVSVYLSCFLLQNYWVFGLFPSSGILENTTFRKLDLLLSSGEGGGEDTYSVGPLRKS